MSDLKICRICLRTACKTYEYDRYNLKSYYEEILAVKVKDMDGLPHYFCYECATMLHKFHKFKVKCYMGQQLLRSISWSGPITFEAVYKVDRKAKDLISPLEILSTTSKRVKTYNKTDSSDDSDDDSESDDDLESDDSDENAESESDTDNSVDIVNTYDDHRDDDSVIVNDNHIIDLESDLVDENKTDYNITENQPEIDPDDFETQIETNHIEAIPTEPKSPERVFVTENVSGLLEKESAKKNRKLMALEAPKIPDYTPKFVKTGEARKWKVDLSKWKKTSLSEEEALDQFRKRAEHPRYIKSPYKCSLCLTGFSREDISKRHEVRHAESQGYLECRMCKYRFKSDYDLRKHMRMHYTMYECLKCSLVCSLLNTAILHQKVHSGEKMKCQHCGNEFKHASSYYSHLRTHRSTHLCTLCGVSFVSQMGLTMHKKRKHVTEEIVIEDENNEKVSTFCEKCDINFETRKAYEEHLFHSAMHIVENENEDTASGKDKQNSFPKKDGVDVAKERKFFARVKGRQKTPGTCHQCGKHFESYCARLKHHKSEHPGSSFDAPSERFVCDLCGALIPQGSVRKHMESHYNQEKKHQCHICRRYFQTGLGLKKHVGIAHRGVEKPFGCTQCDKRFMQRHRMKLHYEKYHKA